MPMQLDLHTELRRVQHQLQDATVEFNLDTFVCGTTACIAGWIRENNREFFGRVRFQTVLYHFGSPDELEDLCGIGPDWLEINPRGDFIHLPTDTRREEVTAEQAVIAIENFITRGNAHWEEILNA